MQKERLVGLDFIKWVAIFMVVAGHCADFVSPAERFTDEYRLWGALWGTLMRPAVPLFVMVTGALLLPVQQTMLPFYRKRLPRLLVPFLIWSLVYNLFPWITGCLGYPPEVITQFFPWGETSQSWHSAWQRITMIPFNFSSYGVQLWYVYLLIGLYLYLPIFSAWVRQAGSRERKIFLALWAVSLFIPYLRQYLSEQLWGTCSWNEFGMLYYFAGFNGYLLLGYEMRHANFTHYAHKWDIAALLIFLLGYAITFTGFRYILSLGNQPESMVELFFTYCSPNVLLMSVAFFWWGKRCAFRSQSLQRHLKSVAEATLGMWMIHYLLLGPCYHTLAAFHLPTMCHLLVCSLLLFFLSWGVVTLVRQYGGRWGKWIMG